MAGSAPIAMLTFVMATLAATFQLLPLLLALALVPLMKGRLQSVLVLVDLWLLSELLATVVDPGYRFGSLLIERVIASALQLIIAYAALTCWRQWRLGSASVSAH
ncbi:MAG: hypothetical protein ACREJ0_09985 [Geminicoccaceae bacterium]